MKIILSRKGFDSAYGGYPSPILPNNKMISLPIPCERDFTKYSDLKIDDETYYYLMKQLKLRDEGGDIITEITYFDLMTQLKMKQLKSKISDKRGQGLTKDTKCHLDPDICKEVIERREHWKPCFGQIKQAQSHLCKKEVEENDLFLFFGWFKRTILKNGSLQFDESAPDLHIIFGYLQIGEIMKKEDEIPDWMQKYSHARDKYREIPKNAIYVAGGNLTWDESKSGAGVFRFNDNLVLTKKRLSKSKWRLDEFFNLDGVKISYHSKNSWKEEEKYFQSAHIGQEFIIEDNNEVENWVKKIINNNE